MVVVEQLQRASEGVRGPGLAEGLECRGTDVGARIASQGGDMSASEGAIPSEQPDRVEADHVVGMSEERYEPFAHARREAVEVGGDALRGLGPVRETLDETVHGPLVLRRQPSEHADGCDAVVRVAASQPALEKSSRARRLP
jgi:hypothetical protein